MGNNYDLYRNDEEREYKIFSGKNYIKIKNYFFVYDLKNQKLLYSDFRNLLNEIFYENYELIDINVFSNHLSENTKTIWLENFGTIKYIYPQRYIKRDLKKIFDRLFECNYSFDKLF